MLDDEDEWGQPPPLNSEPVSLLKRVGEFVSRNIYNIAIVAIAGFGILVAWWLLSRKPNVSIQNFNQVTVGMKESEVFAILGPDSGMKEGVVPAPGPLEDGKPVQPEWKAWRNENGEILIAFVNGKVRWKRFVPP